MTRLNDTNLKPLLLFFKIGPVPPVAHFDDGWDLGVDVVVAEVETGSEGAFVEQRVLVELDLAAGVPLVQAHGAVGKVDHFPEDQLWSWRGKIKK